MGYSQRRDKGDYRWVPACSGLYRLYRGPYIVYIGQTGDLVSRLQQHERDDPGWGTYDYETTRRVRKAQRLKMEQHRFKGEQPSWNVQHNP
jgi:hypothetical protein